MGVNEAGETTVPGSGGRCITVSLPQPELDRIGKSLFSDIIKPNFMVSLSFSLITFVQVKVFLCAVLSYLPFTRSLLLLTGF